MKTDYTIIRADNTEEQGSVDWPRAPKYETMKALIGPIVKGPMEHVYVLHNEKPASMFVDESALIRAQVPPRNEKATRIYRAAAMKKRPGIYTESLPPIFGDVILFDRVVWY